MLKNYLTITKPGIIFGNMVSTAAGFFLAAKTEHVDTTLFFQHLLVWG